MMKRMGFISPMSSHHSRSTRPRNHIHFIVSSLDFGTFDVVSIILQHIKLDFNRISHF